MGKLTNCPDCGKPVSTAATACPSCGRPAAKPRKRIGCVPIVLIVGAVWMVVAALSSDRPQPQPDAAALPPAGGPNTEAAQQPLLVPGMMQEASDFLREHPEIGRPAGVRNLIAWFKGKVQRVDMSDGRSLAFYEKDGKIITVVDRGSDELVWGKHYEPEKFQRVDRAAGPEIPAYTMADVIELTNHRKHGEAIVPSLSVATTTPQERESIARAIAAKEQVDNVTLYTNEESRKANSSASYSEAHPGALYGGYLGSFEDGQFRMPVGADVRAIHEARRDLDNPARAEVRAAVEKARLAADEYSTEAGQAKVRWRVFDKEVGPAVQRHGLTREVLKELLSEYPDFRVRPESP